MCIFEIQYLYGKSSSSTLLSIPNEVIHICDCPALLMQIVCKVPREWVKSKFLCQDADVMYLADKCIVVECFVHEKFSWRRKVLWQNHGHWKWTRVWCWQSALVVEFYVKNISDRLDPLRKSVSFDVFFPCPTSGILFTRIHNNANVLVPWIWDRFPVFWALAQNISQFYITYYIEITCHYMATWSTQKLWIRAVARWVSWERPWKSSCCKLAL